MKLKLLFLIFQIPYFRLIFADPDLVISANQMDLSSYTSRIFNSTMEVIYQNDSTNPNADADNNIITDINCEKYQFKCTDGSCIDNDDICDKKPDCSDGLDEGDICLSNTGSKKRGYGEFCNKQLKCNSSNWFNCLENRCECAKPNEMTYDLEKGKCLALSSEICKFEIGKAGDLGQYALYESIGCIPNSNCTSDGLCRCFLDFEESDEGFCTEKANFTQTCKFKSNCKESQFLDCIEGVCICSNNSIWDFDLSVCVGLAGQNCIDGKCTKNSYCNSSNTECTCSKDFYKDANGTCSAKKSYSEDCSNSGECLENEHLICSEKGQCECNSEYSTWRSGYQACVGIPENNCINGQCVAEATCYRSQEKYDQRNVVVEPEKYTYMYGAYYDQYNNMYYSLPTTTTESPILTKSPNMDENFQKAGICKCSDGMNFQHSKDKSKCWPEYGQTCSNFSNPCDSDFFVCKENKCACPSPYHQEYYSAIGFCRSFPGGPCVEGDILLSSCRWYSECVLNKYNITNCECKKEYVEVVSGDCKLSHGQMCASASDCENVTPLQCINGICDCDDKLTRYDEHLRKCLSIVGAKCTIIENNCVKNAFCDQGNVSIKGRCECKNGYFANKQQFCVPIISGI